MAKSNKVIITCAVTGAIHTPSMSPYLPITPQEIADAAIGAAEAGAAVVHLHARNPKDGRPDQTPEAFLPFVKVIKQASNVVINLTTGGSPTMTVEERVRPAATLKPEVASLNMGTMNFGLYPMIPRYKGKFKHDWEEPYLEGSKKGMFKNTFADIEYILTTCAEQQHPLRDRVLRHRPSLHAAALPRPRPGQAAAVHPVGVRHPRRHRRASRRRDADEAHRRPSVRRQLSLVGARRRRQSDAGRGAMAASMGGNVRVGLEDSLWIGPGKLAESNAQQVKKVRQIIEGLGLEIANPDEAREILSLKGGDKVNF